MKTKLLIATLGIAAIVGGCTQQGRDEYSQAAQTSGRAAEQIGKAAKTDADATGKSLDRMAKSADKHMSADTATARRKLNNVEVTAEVNSSLSAAKGLDASQIKVSTSNGVITLTGSVPSDTQREQADDVAKGIAGTKYQVEDQINVTNS
jgi:osmotically-inducible protein OsmY